MKQPNSRTWPSDIHQMDNLYPVLSVKANHLYANRCFAHPKKPRWCSQILLIYRKLAGMPTPWKSKTKQSGWSLGWFIFQGFPILPMGKVWSKGLPGNNYQFDNSEFYEQEKWCSRATRIPMLNNDDLSQISQGFWWVRHPTLNHRGTGVKTCRFRTCQMTLKRFHAGWKRCVGVMAKPTDINASLFWEEKPFGPKGQCINTKVMI